MSNSILITGGSGFLGHALVSHLLAFSDYSRVCVYSRGEHRQAEMREAFGDDARLRWFIGDVRDRGRLVRALDGVDDVIHAAALKRIEVGAYNPDEMVKTNVLGANNVLEAARRVGVKRCLLISSDKAFEPVSPYGQTKALAEALFHAANGYGGMMTAACRYGNVAGSTGSVIPIWRRLGDAAVMTDPDATRFWMTKFQAVEFVMDTLKNMRGGELAIPSLPAFRLGDLAGAMEISPRIVGLRAFEKRHEGMGPGNTSDVARRMSVDELRCALAET